MRWHDVVVVHRLHFPLPVNYLCYSFCGACFATGDYRHLLDPPVLLAAMANLLIILSGLALNTAADIRTDERQADREQLANAALRIGRERVFRWAAIEMCCALVLATAISQWTGHLLGTAFAAGAIGLHMLYDLEPVRLKRRGFPGPFAFCAAVHVLPCLLSFTAAGPLFDAPVYLIFAGIWILASGRTVWWSVPDRSADAATGMRTPPVRYGAVRALAMSCLIMLAGLAGIGWGLWWLYGPVWALLGVTAHAAFLGNSLLLLRRTAEGATPSSARMLKRAMPMVSVGDVALVIIPLIV
ncbi:UbiA prenyltransferase family protein [Amycolatopsis anabasis]|uniref:UbiA prenyltransferase family protein n=1 Tax=Amycolatopsis anabasis TaxID=1840409 RepID=UPI001FE8454F|nr:UbiA family prenyltransferase [Amycolatopsis anabasis]